MDITVKDVRKTFNGCLVLNDFSATFKAGRVTCIMGPSGSGKTTLLNLLMGFLTPDRGTITGVPAKKSAVFQEDRLCETFGALTNVAMVLRKPRDEGTIRSHLEALGLGDDLDKPLSEYSGGMKRRVALVRAILAESDVLFLDEPLKGLDDDTKQMTVAYLKAHFGGRTVIMVTHDRKEVQALGADLVILGWEA